MKGSAVVEIGVDRHEPLYDNSHDWTLFHVPTFRNSSLIHRHLLKALRKGFIDPNNRANSPQTKGCLGVSYLIVGVIVVVAILLIALFWAGTRTGTLTQDQKVWLNYGNFFIVASGLASVLIGFLIILQVAPPADGTQALGLLTALFGAIAGLVGTYFGVKQSADAREGAEKLATLSGSAGTTAPTITIDPPSATVELNQSHEVTATVTSVDGSPKANVAVMFAVTGGPDLNVTGTEMTDGFGRAVFTFTNNGGAGTDTVEATALKGKGTATVDFEAPWYERSSSPRATSSVLLERYLDHRLSVCPNHCAKARSRRRPNRKLPLPRRWKLWSLPLQAKI